MFSNHSKSDVDIGKKHYKKYRAIRGRRVLRYSTPRHGRPTGPSPDQMTCLGLAIALFTNLSYIDGGTVLSMFSNHSKILLI